jgi:long-chain acyl-CoA synthetase
VPREEAQKAGMTLAWWAERQADRTAIWSSHGDRTFRELNARANKLARALRARGLAAGDAVAIICHNRPEFVETYAAALRSGLRLTTINWHLTGGEAAYIVDDCEAKAVIADASLSTMAREAMAGASRVEFGLALGGEIEGFASYEEAIAPEGAEDLDDPTLGRTMLYTSGTTGRPKGVFRKSTAASVDIYGYREGDVHLCTGPLYHAAPLAFSLAAPLTYGAGVVLMDGWDAEEALALIEQHRVTHTHMVPTMFHRLLSLPEEARASHDLSALRQVLHGAAPCPVSVKQRLIEWLGPVVVEYYAATEGTGTFVDSATWLSRPGTVGRPKPDDQVKVGDEDGNELPRGEIGLVYLKAPEATRFEYFKDAEKTQRTYRGQYFTLGDVGYMDDDGFLFLTDRTANLIISGGVNIYPAEVDAILLDHPAVGDAATIGVPNEEWGEEVLAVIEPQAGVDASDELAAELIAFCRERLAGYKCPRRVDFIDHLPRLDNGKIYKRLLRERYRATQGSTN